MNIGIGIGTGKRTEGEVVAEVGIDMTVTGIIRVKEILITEAGAAVQVLTIAKTVDGEDMMMNGVVGASRMGGIKCWLLL